ncbi:MAG TPA: glycosyltransferase family 2 protein, partial [Polyangiaceae bacterium]
MSCLCVTEDRAAFLPWLLWCFDRQTWPRKELVIVDSSLAPPALGERGDVRVVRAPHRSRVAEKRNLALREARGELLAWFDDDDWQHPERLSVLVPALAPGITHAGPASSWFLDLPARHCERYVGPEQPIFNGALFRTSAAAALEFDTSRARAADTYWMRKLAAHGAYRVTPEPLFFWLSHARNLSNPRTRVRCTLPEATLREALGPAWADTDAELERLRARLADEPRATAKPASVVRAGSGLPRIVSAWNDRTPLPEPPRELARAARETRFVVPAPDWRPPPVSALVKATILDAPYLGAIVPHMLAQAKCRFAERLVIVDPRPEFSGKYRDRPRGTRALLDAVLSKLVREGHVDRVLEVSSERETVERVMSAYFGPEGGALPTYAASGGPIFPTLFGLESVATDHVLQMDADMFFHADGVGWVDEGLKLLTDPSIWLVMSQAGPPAGPVGSRASLGRKNARRARWDGERGVWKFTTASTRYFLTDRRRLRGNVPVVWHAPVELVPLEQCLGAGLQRAGTFRVNLA